MIRRRIVSIMVMATGVGAAVAVFVGDDGAVSLRIWLGVTALAFAALSMGELLEVVPLQNSQFRLLARVFRTAQDPEPPRNWNLRELDSLLSRSTDNVRAFDQQLRPRLIALTRHALPIVHSIDLDRDPERAATILGDVAWLVDPAVADRTPTLNDIETLMTRLDPSNAHHQEATQ